MSSDEMREFCQQLINHAQFKSQRKFLSGSYVEIPDNYRVVRKFVSDWKALLDVDRMYHLTNPYAFPVSQAVPPMYNGDVIRIHSDGQHPGYTKLYREKLYELWEFTMVDLNPNMESIDLHGPANTTGTMDRERDIIASYKTYKVENLRTRIDRSIDSQDDVFAVHSPYWPIEAYEWVTRWRQHGSPSKSTIREVVRYGCDFVHVSHKLCDDKKQWRFSFSQAELIITRNWTMPQRIVYRTLHALCKKIKSEMSNSVLCTYYFKTLMLWATENKDQIFWSEQNLVNSVNDLLCQLVEFLEVKFFPNYFIPSNNMIDHLTDTALSADIETLSQFLEKTAFIDDVICTGRDAEIFDSSVEYCVELPMWIGTSLIIYDAINNIDDNFKDLFSVDLFSPRIDAAMIELADLFKLLTETSAHYNSCSIHYEHKCKALCQSTAFRRTDDCITLNCSRTVARWLVVNWYMPFDASHTELRKKLISEQGWNSQKSNNKEMYGKCLLYNKAVTDAEMEILINEEKCKEKIIAWYIKAIEDNEFTNNVEFCKEFSGKSPTVNISWIISKAFLANLYYTTLHNYTSTEETCNEIVNTYQLSYYDQQFAEKTLPVVFSTQWSSVFDKELQEMLGFHSLCSFLFYKADRRRSVYLGVCPVHFALYLKNRCAADQLFFERLMDRTALYAEHVQACRCDPRVNNCESTLAAILTLEMFAVISRLYVKGNYSSRCFGLPMPLTMTEDTMSVRDIVRNRLVGLWATANCIKICCQRYYY